MKRGREKGEGRGGNKIRFLPYDFSVISVLYIILGRVEKSGYHKIGVHQLLTKQINMLLVSGKPTFLFK